MAADLHRFARRFARRFATETSHLLNATVCTGIGITSVVLPTRPGLVFVGCGLAKKSMDSRRFPVRIGRAAPGCWAKVTYKFCLNDDGSYPMVLSSFFGVYAGDDERRCLFHLDYERDKGDGYPEAHLQVYGDSPALNSWKGWDDKRGLERLHFPVGDRRFRPILEDVIEFLIAEGLTSTRPGWREVLDSGRAEFRRIQLCAAVRRDPETARRTLQHLVGT